MQGRRRYEQKTQTAVETTAVVPCTPLPFSNLVKLYKKADKIIQASEELKEDLKCLSEERQALFFVLLEDARAASKNGDASVRMSDILVDVNDSSYISFNMVLRTWEGFDNKIKEWKGKSNTKSFGNLHFFVDMYFARCIFILLTRRIGTYSSQNQKKIRKRIYL
mmetsp:Transcript_44422/g.115460  ORF Transcript_44422/g.115460 Transcript_44422/m.115460 type:complete len:165 (-) Transcript_44422:783-1277(-)